MRRREHIFISETINTVSQDPKLYSVELERSFQELREKAEQYALIPPKTDKFPAVDIELKGEIIPMVIDTGAYISIVSSTLAESFPCRLGDIVNLRTVKGDQISNDGVAIITFKLGNFYISYPFVIVLNTPTTIQVGWDFIEKMRVTVCGERRFVYSPLFGEIPISSRPRNLIKRMKWDSIVKLTPAQSGDEEEQEQSTSQPSNQETKASTADEPIYATIRQVKESAPNWDLRISEKINLPPRSKTFVPITTVGLEIDRKAVILPSRRLFRRNGLLVPNMLISTKTRYIPVINPGFTRKYLCKTTRLGKLSSYVEDEDIMAFNTEPRPQSSDEEVSIRNVSEMTPEEAAIREKHKTIFKIGEIPDELKNRLYDVLYRHDKLFAWKGNERGNVTRVKFHVECGSCLPTKMRPNFPRSPKESAVIEEKVTELLERGIIQRSHSAYDTYPFLIKQTTNDGQVKWRMVINYVALNLTVKPLSYPLPRIDQLLEKIRGKRYLSNLDLKDAFHLIPLDESSKEKTAFSCDSGLYEYTHLPFGLKTSPSFFSQLMDTILKSIDVEDQSIISAYIDDVIICSSDPEIHLKQIDSVLEKLLDWGLRVSPNKCNFFFKKLVILGLNTDASGVEISERHLEAVKSLPAPTTKKLCERRLGFLGYFRRFVPGFAELSKPLEELTKDDVPFIWTEVHENAFQELKKRLLESARLNHFLPNQEAILECDGSLEGVGAILLQTRPEGSEVPIAFASRKLTKSERNYQITAIEALAIVHGLKKFRHICFGERIHIRTDHRPLMYIIRNTKGDERLPSNLLRMLLFIRSWDIASITYRKGKEMQGADTLSRDPCDEPTFEDLDMEEFKMFKVRSVTPGSSTRKDEETSQDDKTETLISFHTDTLREEQYKDPALCELKSILTSGSRDQIGPKVRHHVIFEDVLYYKRPDMPRFVPVLPSHLRKEILEEAHDSKWSCHSGRQKTYRLISDRYYWHKMRKDITYYVRSCEKCQKMKASRRKPIGLFSFNEIPEIPGRCFQIDILGPLNRSAKNNKYIITAICTFSKYVIMGAVSEATAEKVANFITEKICLVFGVPVSIKTDMGTHFTAEMIKHLTTVLGIRHILGTPYHPEGQGMVEKSHDTINTKLRMLVSSHCRDWDRHLNFLAFSINSQYSESTHYSPHFLVYGSEPLFPSQLQYDSQKYGYVTEVESRFAVARDLAQQSLLNNQFSCEKKTNKNRRHEAFKPGDKVLILRFGRKKNIPSKLMCVYVGPLVILKRCDNIPTNYLVEHLSKKNKQRYWIHSSKLIRFVERDKDFLKTNESVIRMHDDIEDDGSQGHEQPAQSSPQMPILEEESENIYDDIDEDDACQNNSQNMPSLSPEEDMDVDGRIDFNRRSRKTKSVSFRDPPVAEVSDLEDFEPTHSYNLRERIHRN